MTNASAEFPLLVFDCDPGCDDAVAIALVATAKRYAKVDLLTVSGNVPVEQTTANAYRIIAVLKRDGLAAGMAVYRGSGRSLIGDAPSAASVHGRDGLGDVPSNFVDPPLNSLMGGNTGSAVARLLRLAKRNSKDKEFHLLCTGPLTNLATALNLMQWDERQRFWERCKRLVIMGGSFGSQGNITHSAEFNTFFDPVATQMVLDFWREHHTPPGKAERIHFVPLEATETVGIPLERQYSEKASDSARFLFYALQQYGGFHAFHCGPPSGFGIAPFDERKYVWSQLGGSSGVSEVHKFCYLHDPLAAWVLLADHPDSFHWEEAEIRVDGSHGESRGRIIHCTSKLRGSVPYSLPALGTEVNWLNPMPTSVRVEFVSKIVKLLRIRLRRHGDPGR